MTEDEAKTKWCPFVRNAPGKPDGQGGYNVPASAPSYNRIAGSSPVGPCIGSACAAWRNAEPLKGKVLETAPWSKVAPEGFREMEALPDPEHPGLVSTFWVKRAPQIPQGFCGLAGPPS